MLKKIGVLLMFIIVMQSYGQNRSAIYIDDTSIDFFIFQVKGEETKKFIVEHTEEANKLREFIRNNVYLVQFKRIPENITDKLSNYSKLVTTQEAKFNPKKFNPLVYGLENVTSSKRIQIDGTNYVVFINPIEE